MTVSDITLDVYIILCACLVFSLILTWKLTEYPDVTVIVIEDFHEVDDIDDDVQIQEHREVVGEAA